MISIAVACKDLGDRETVIAMLRKQDDFHIACIAEDGFDLIRSASTQSPDVAIMDFHLNDIESPALAPIIKRKSPSTSLIVLCSQEDCDVVEESLNAGISGCLKKQRGFDNLASSVRSVYYGGLYISRSDCVTVLRGFALRAESPKCESGACPVFSPTELGILSGIVLGHSDTEIAASLNIAVGTVRNCVNHAKKTADFRNRTQIAIYALLNGMIRPKNFRPGKRNRH
ncbi:MAG: response regulator transcription factor [Treponema sp.]|jgi:DNA-binding NarL/FixJ family response regulator|nr:response regulator transcription factor [Treponema sp.]